MNREAAGDEIAEGDLVRDLRWGWELRVEERFPGGAKLRYVHNRQTVMVGDRGLVRDFERAVSEGGGPSPAPGGTDGS